MYKIRREVEGSQILEEAFYPHGIEGLGHVEDHLLC